MDYSTLDRDYDGSATNTLSKDSRQLGDRDSEKRSLSSNKNETSNLSNIVAEINTRNMKGPNSYRPSNEMNLINPQDLPNVDIGYNNKTNSQRSQQPNNSTRSNNNNNYNPSNRSYQNQLDTPFEDQQPSNKSSVRETNGGMIQPPPANRNQNKVQFPVRNPPQQSQQQPQQRYVSSKF
jgi:hypothetical protein